MFGVCVYPCVGRDVKARRAESSGGGGADDDERVLPCYKGLKQYSRSSIGRRGCQRRHLNFYRPRARARR